jgi:DNA-binding transcriptional LysR family regulator
MQMALKLSIESVEILDAIARKGSFAAAADSLYKVPSALTYQMQKLEREIGVTLFNRSGHRTTLTEAGEALLKEGRNLLEMAREIEAHVKRVATGIETNLIIAVTDLLSVESIYPIVHTFYQQGFGTRIKITQEVFGAWDAIATKRADIAIGAPGDMPTGGGYATKLLGNAQMAFVVAPNHPLAQLPEPLQEQDIIKYRVVAAADSSRNLPPRTAGILTGQDVLTVPNMQSKINAQLAGLGVGHLPCAVAEHYASLGQLVIKQLAPHKPSIPLYLAWRQQPQNSMGQAQSWFLKALSQTTVEQLQLQKNGT